jgi:hypothetical protein
MRSEPPPWDTPDRRGLVPQVRLEAKDPLRLEGEWRLPRLALGEVLGQVKLSGEVEVCKGCRTGG